MEVQHYNLLNNFPPTNNLGTNQGWGREKNVLNLSGKVFSTKVLELGTLLLRLQVETGRNRHFAWSSESREGLAACSLKGVPSFLSYFKTLSIGPAPGIEPVTSLSAFKRSTD